MKTIALLLLGCLAVASSYRVTLEEDVPVHDGDIVINMVSKQTLFELATQSPCELNET